MRSIDALAPEESTDTSEVININESKTADAIGELNANLKEMTDSTKESFEKLTTNFQNAITKAFEKKPTDQDNTDNGGNE